ncbi:uncharacterized protein ARMOST_21106 [Armillaria ostoyae]|uniref:Uncharacterized protein n=1 Tax=Armillaria ostoyae TaxID=47428 RepID=A0A284S973_ARMOS|nr:uncharacterized protein ARMOST_21106 [Armillaria ostoyae]
MADHYLLQLSSLSITVKSLLAITTSDTTMIFNVYTTELTATRFDANTIQKHMQLSECLQEFLPSLKRTLGQQFTDENELDFVIYDLWELAAKNNMAALFTNHRRLLGVVYWAQVGTIAAFKSIASVHPAPYRVAGTFGAPDSIFVLDTIAGGVQMEYTMNFVVQLTVS